MDDSLGALLFAEDLMKYIFDKCDFIYVPRDACEVGKFREHIGTSPFRVVIGNAVCARIEEDLDKLSAMFEQEFKALLNATSFTRHIMKIAPRWFPEGYHPASFIEFCVMVSSVSISYHEAGYHHISCLASEVIAAVLTGHIVSEDFNEKSGWAELIRVCTQINNAAKTKYL
ncbi:hypothetical protein AVEN_95385-1 [Araneus ventricosus]|uniref:Uncharacterized protein n=1 Tax=Araneus ventricosus TaxID=182803 RepID=A0A4Y2CHW9_ARAVE|nr:hypothetical protein AVEN_95385-1 [Araneus ventricosus]